MKNNFYKLFFLFVLSLFFAGCYTQVAVKEIASQKERSDYSYEEEGNYDSANTDESDESAYSYTDDTDIVINKYYYGSYPFYRRYFWGYHPTIIIGIGWSSWYYDPFCYDPFFYWNWCGTWWYYPTYYYYSYYPYYYPPYYYHWGYWGYYDGYKYRERSRDVYSIRNNSGLRNSFVTRDALTRTDSRSFNKESRTRDRSREITVDRNSTSRSREFDQQRVNREKDRIDIKREERKRDPVLDDSRNKRDNTIRTDRSDRQIETRKRYEEIFKKRSNDNYSTPPRKEDNRRREVETNKSPDIKKDNSIKRERTETRTKNETRVERRKQETTRTYSPPPQRTYSPPSNNTPPPRTSNPPSGSSQDGGRRR